MGCGVTVTNATPPGWAAPFLRLRERQMDKTEKLSLARKKLKKFQSKNSSQPKNKHQTNAHHEVIGNGSAAIEQDEQLEVHSQTIDILVSEKTHLLSTLAATQSELESTKRKFSLVSEKLNNTVREVEEGVRERKALTDTLAERNRVLQQSRSMVDELNTSLANTRNSLDDKQQEVTELLSKLSAQTKEIETLQKTSQDVTNKLVMQELLVEQLQSSPPSSPTSSGVQERVKVLEEVRSLTASLQAVTRERDQAMSDSAALRDAIMSNKQDAARKLGDVKTRLAETEIRMRSLADELAGTHADRDSRLSGAAMELTALTQSHQQQLSIIEKERDSYKSRVHQLGQENSQLTTANQQLQQTNAQLEDTVAALRGEAVDQHKLLSTIAQDKATVSRAVAQNKELKEQLTELQEAFVQQTHRNMELATDLESHQLKLRRLEQHEAKSVALSESREKLNNEGKTTDDEDNEEEEEASSLNLSRIQELTEECDSLRREKNQLLEELERLHITPSSSPSPMEDQEDEEEGEEGESINQEQASVLQHSFTALQQRFVDLMTEKAALHDQLQECEHVIVQLAGETETITEYVALYQTQREALKLRFDEKNKLIQQLCQEKASLEIRLQEVQLLVKQLASTRKPADPSSPSLPPHLRTTQDKTVNELDMTTTVDQLVTIIDQQFQPGQPALPCQCCSGQLLMV